MFQQVVFAKFVKICKNLNSAEHEQHLSNWPTLHKLRQAQLRDDELPAPPAQEAAPRSPRRFSGRGRRAKLKDTILYFTPNFSTK